MPWHTIVTIIAILVLAGLVLWVLGWILHRLGTSLVLFGIAFAAITMVGGSILAAFFLFFHGGTEPETVTVYRDATPIVIIEKVEVPATPIVVTQEIVVTVEVPATPIIIERTVEVTRVVEQTVVVTATPTPSPSPTATPSPPPCQIEDSTEVKPEDTHLQGRGWLVVIETDEGVTEPILAETYTTFEYIESIEGTAHAFSLTCSSEEVKEFFPDAHWVPAEEVFLPT